jgi:hypothetical protein
MFFDAIINVNNKEHAYLFLVGNNLGLLVIEVAHKPVTSSMIFLAPLSTWEINDLWMEYHDWEQNLQI